MAFSVVVGAKAKLCAMLGKMHIWQLGLRFSLKGTEDGCFGLQPKPVYLALLHATAQLLVTVACGGDVGPATLRSIITMGCAPWPLCDARPRYLGGICFVFLCEALVELSSPKGGDVACL